MSLDDTKENLEWRKCEFEYEPKNTHDIEIQNGIIRIHENEVNDIDGCNLLHDITNPTKRTKYLNSHYSHIIHVCMNKRKGKEKFKNLQILLYCGYSFTIVMGSIV